MCKKKKERKGKKKQLPGLNKHGPETRVHGRSSALFKHYREREVLLAYGFDNAELSHRLHLSHTHAEQQILNGKRHFLQVHMEITWSEHF